MSQINIFDEITVDGFCGGGGWSTGFELALARANWPEACGEEIKTMAALNDAWAV